MRPSRVSQLALLCGLFSLTFLLSAAEAQNAQRQNGLQNFGAALDNPSGIAVQPDTGHVFVAERRGVIRFTPRQRRANANQNSDAKRPKRKFTEINGFPTDVYGKGPMYDIGPLGLAFLDAEHLVVGDGSRPDGSELVRVFKVGAEGAAKAQKEGDAVHTLGPIPPGDETVKGEGNFYGVAVLDGAIFVTNNGDDTKGWVSRAKSAAGPLELHIPTKMKVEVDAPVAITTNKQGDLVVGQMGEMTQPGDSLLTIYDPDSGELKASYETGLSDIAGLAYSPKTGKLYAADFSWHDTTQGGLFELTVSGDKCTAKKLFELDKPTALAFDEDGNLYVTVFGTAEEGAKQKPGKVLRIGARPLNRAG